MKLKGDTYFEAINRELVWFKENTQYRLDFTLRQSLVVVTYYVNEFPLFPKLLIWCNNYIPMFPHYAKITWYQLPDIALELNKNEYKKIVKDYIDKILSSDTSIFLNKNLRR
jgi:hypothetical protein